MIKTGCCGWPVSKTKYCRHFKVIEIQQTFYQFPSLKTVQKWRQDVPPDFEFTVKAPQLITHPATSPTYRRLKEPIPESRKGSYGFFRPTREVLEAWRMAAEICDALRCRIVLFQCPASFKPTPENKRNLRNFFRKIPRKDYIFIWEPRGRWQPEEIKALCKELDLVHGVDPFKDKPQWGKIGYFRLHGIGGYRYKYTDKELRQLQGMIRPGAAYYILFNNTNMFQDAQRFFRMFPVAKR